MKNYLWFAERLGARVLPERLRRRPTYRRAGWLGGYVVTSVRSGAWLRRERHTMTARGVVVAAGPLGTNQLLADCKHTRRSLASRRASARSCAPTESIQAVTAPDDSRDFSRSVAITSSIYPDPDTHIEVVTYGREADLMSTLFTALTGGGKVTPAEVDRGDAQAPAAHDAPAVAVQVVAAHRDPAGDAVARHGNAAPGQPAAARARVRLQTEQDTKRPNRIPAAEAAARGSRSAR